jgi:hypothetical protein
MAVTKNPVNSTIRISLVIGLNATGGPILRNASLSNVKSEAVDQDLFDVANALVGLQEYQLNGISRLDTADLTEA